MSEKYISRCHTPLQVMVNTEGYNTDDQNATTTKSGGPPQFLPRFLNRPIMIRMMDGQPVKGVLEAFNNYELLLDLGQGKKLIVFKGAISSIDYEDKSPKEKKEIKRW